ncbi:MAG: hypothetical protein R2688_08220 [Fimbriimonadaceae bacterium]
MLPNRDATQFFKNVTAGQNVEVRLDYPGGSIHSKVKVIWAKQK